jgi:hypothetical protein
MLASVAEGFVTVGDRRCDRGAGTQMWSTQCGDSSMQGGGNHETVWHPVILDRHSEHSGSCVPRVVGRKAHEGDGSRLSGFSKFIGVEN